MTSTEDDKALGLIIFGILLLVLIIAAISGPWDRNGISFWESVLYRHYVINVCQCDYVMHDRSPVTDAITRPPIVFDPQIDLDNPPNRSTKMGKVLFRDEIIA